MKFLEVEQNNLIENRPRKKQMWMTNEILDLMEDTGKHKSKDTLNYIQIDKIIKRKIT